MTAAGAPVRPAAAAAPAPTAAASLASPPLARAPLIPEDDEDLLPTPAARRRDLSPPHSDQVLEYAGLVPLPPARSPAHSPHAVLHYDIPPPPPPPLADQGGTRGRSTEKRGSGARPRPAHSPHAVVHYAIPPPPPAPPAHSTPPAATVDSLLASLRSPPRSGAPLAPLAVPGPLPYVPAAAASPRGLPKPRGGGEEAQWPPPRRDSRLPAPHDDADDAESLSGSVAGVPTTGAAGRAPFSQLGAFAAPGGGGGRPGAPGTAPPPGAYMESPPYNYPQPAFAAPASGGRGGAAAGPDLAHGPAALEKRRLRPAGGEPGNRHPSDGVRSQPPLHQPAGGGHALLRPYPAPAPGAGGASRPIPQRAPPLPPSSTPAAPVADTPLLGGTPPHFGGGGVVRAMPFSAPSASSSVAAGSASAAGSVDAAAPAEQQPPLSKMDAAARAIEEAMAAAAAATAEVAALLDPRKARGAVSPQSLGGGGESLPRPRGGSLTNLSLLDEVSLDGRSLLDDGGTATDDEDPQQAQRIAELRRLHLQRQQQQHQGPATGALQGRAAPAPPPPPAAPVLRPAPLREVRRVFDAYTAYSDGVLPLYKLPDLSRALGVPLPRGFLADAENARAVDPAGEGLVNRAEFCEWFRRYTVQVRGWEGRGKRGCCDRRAPPSSSRAATEGGRRRGV